MDQEAKRIRRYAAREGLVGLMNSPKWQRLLVTLEPYAVRYRVKFITSERSMNWIDWLAVVSGGRYLDMIVGGVSSVEIEWLDIAPRDDSSNWGQPITLADLASLLIPLRLQVEPDDGFVRVVAYQRPSPSSPQ